MVPGNKVWLLFLIHVGSVFQCLLSFPLSFSTLRDENGMNHANKNSEDKHVPIRGTNRFPD
jgi:hypothetical protein